MKERRRPVLGNNLAVEDQSFLVLLDTGWRFHCTLLHGFTLGENAVS
jgi:hypothetical protein